MTATDDQILDLLLEGMPHERIQASLHVWGKRIKRVYEKYILPGHLAFDIDEELQSSESKCAPLVIARHKSELQAQFKHSPDRDGHRSWSHYAAAITGQSRGKIEKALVVLRRGCDHLIDSLDNGWMTVSRAWTIAQHRDHAEQERVISQAAGVQSLKRTIYMQTEVVTFSRTQSFKTCRRKHHLQYNLGIRPTSDAKALRMGSAWHTALHHLKVNSDAAAYCALDELYLHCPEYMEQADWDIEYTTLQQLLNGYVWRWGESLQWTRSERGFHLQLRNPWTNRPSRNWSLAGKIDGICMLEDGRLAVGEHKLIGQDVSPASDYWQRLQLDPQVSIYVIAARAIGHPVDTVIYDLTRKPTIRPEQVPVLDHEGLKVVLDSRGQRVYGKNGKPRQTGSRADDYVLQTRSMTADEWGEKLLDDICTRPDFYYCRREIPRLDQDLQATLGELWHVTKAMRAAFLSDMHYPTVGRDTCSWCAYWPLCSANYSPGSLPLPEGFVAVEDIHPELEGLLNGKEVHENADENAVEIGSAESDA